MRTAAFATCAIWLSVGAAHAKSVDAHRLSLPQAGASIEGLGRNFTASLASGTSSYGIDLSLPPAVGGFAPRVTLEYDSGGGVTELGMGWRLDGLVSIRRRVEDGLPRFDANDTFELAGLGTSSRLVEIEPRLYRPRYETGSFARVTRSQDGESWEIRDKAGTVHRLGGSGHVESEGTRVATYLLREQVDLHGHAIRYEWDTNGGYGLLQRVTWNGENANARIELILDYEPRPDALVLFSSGIRRSLDRRLKTLEVRRGGELVRRMTLAYGEGIHPQLSRVTVVGADGETALPELTFEYTQARFATDQQIVTMVAPPSVGPSDPDVALVDLNGDALPDVLVGRAGEYRSYVNHDGVAWRPAESWSAGASPSVTLGARGVDLADLDGDGVLDLVVKSGTADFRYLPGKDPTCFLPAVEINTKPNFTFEDPDVRVADIDGDRRADVWITTSAGLAVGYNINGRDWTVPAPVGMVDPEQPVRFSSGDTHLCDANGDRLTDLCVLHSGSMLFRLGRGRGQFEPAEEASNVPSWDPSSPWQLRDLNGDGWVDLVHVGVGLVSYALSVAVGRFGAVQQITNTPTNLDTTDVQFADMNGSGTTDIVWVDTSGQEKGSWKYLELFPTGRGGLLRRIDNGLGKVVTITYAPAAEDAARARDVGKPWSTRMNVALSAVRTITVDSSLGDQLGDLPIVTEYSYRDGTWDPQERTFAGFAGGTERRLGDENAPTLVVNTSFDIGMPRRVLRGLPVASQQQTEDGRVFKRTSLGYATRTLATGMDGTTVEYGYKSSERVEHVEGAEASAIRAVFTEWEQDEFGNVTLEAKWGEVVDGDPLAGEDEVVTRRAFTNDETDWVLGRVISELVEDGQGHRLAMKRYYYDGEAFEGLPLGNVTRGDLKRVESWISGGTMATESGFDHDAHGNVVVALDARGGRSEYDYDAESSTFVVAERSVLDAGGALAWYAEYDPRFGTITSLTDPNAVVTRLRYDALGRVTKVVKAGDSLKHPTLKYSYETASPLSRVRSEQREVSGEDGTLVSVTVVDGLGRKRGELVESPHSGMWRLSGLRSFDTRGNDAFLAYPGESASSELPAATEREGTSMGYDAVGRLVATRNPDGSSANIAYAPLEHTMYDENDSDQESVHANTPTRELSDGLGRLRRVIELEGTQELVAAAYTYDGLGNVREVRDVQGTVRRYAYDGRSRRTEIQDPNAGTWRFTYTNGNDVESRRDPEGNVVSFAYDTLGRVTSEQHALPGENKERPSAAYHYDEASADHATYKNLRGQLSWVEDEAGAVFFNYNERGLVTERTRRWTDGTKHTTSREYDAADRPVRRGYPDHTYLASSYDNGGKLSALGAVVPAIEWTAQGALARVEFGNGVVDQREYDQRQRLVRMTALDKKGTPLRDLALRLDVASRITGVEDRRPDLPKAQRLSMSFTYDDRYRLVEARDAVATTKWELDDTGRVLAVQSGHAASWLNAANAYGEAGAGPDQLTHHGGEAFSYDSAGRLVDDGTRHLVWSPSGRLQSVQRGDVLEEYVYGYDGKRAIKKTTQDGKTTVVRYVDEDVEERDGKLVRYALLDGERVARLDSLPGSQKAKTAETRTPATHPRLPNTPGPRPLAPYALTVLVGLLLALRWVGRRLASMLPHRPPRLSSILAMALLVLSSCGGGSETETSKHSGEGGREITRIPSAAEFYIGDWQQSPIVFADAKGQVTSETAYHPYGSIRQRTKVTEDPWTFAGNEADQGAGLSDFHARPYRPEIGAFLAPDPDAVFEVEKAVENPRLLSAYVYGAADPINRVDRDGRAPYELAEAFESTRVYREIVRVNAAASSPDALLTMGPVATSAETLTGLVMATVEVMKLGTGVAEALNSGEPYGGVIGVLKDVTRFCTGFNLLGSLAAPLAARPQAPGTLPKAKVPPNPFGRRGGPAHQGTVSEVASDIESRGLEVGYEHKVSTPCGAKTARYVDVVGKDSQGNVVEMHQVGRRTVGGNPVSREVKALDDIQAATGRRPEFHPYN